MNKKEISMVVLNYNDASTIIEFVDSLDIDIYKMINLIIVDNHSSDSSFKILKSRYGMKHDVLVTNKNSGYSAGNNYGVKYAINKYNPKYIIISNPDVLIGTDTIMGMLELFNKENIKLVGCKIYGTDGKEQIYGWKLPRYSTIILSSLVGTNRLFVRNHNQYKKSYFKTDYSIVDVVAGSFFIIEKNIFKEVNFLDEDVFLYCEEDILGKKLKQYNYQAAVLNTKGYIHKHSHTISQTYAHLDIYMMAQRSRETYMQKYMNCGKLALRLFNIITRCGYTERKCLLTLRKIFNGR